MKILIGTNNKHKVDEIKAIIDSKFPGRFELVILKDVFNNPPDVVEDGQTLKENALKKAKEYHEMTGLPCAADDTVLEIDALGGAPGVHSARYAGEHGDDKANRAKALKELLGKEADQRTARFKTVICFHNENGPQYCEGICEGKIIEEERGDQGFGYDSIFVPEGYNLTFAEMPADQKNEISHRSRAVRAFAGLIGDL